MRAAIVDPDGRILRIVTCNPRYFALQAGPGETVFALTEGDDGGFLDSTKVVVSDAGDLTPAPGAEVSAPPIAIEYVATGRSS